MDSGRPASLARMSHRECDLICLLEGGGVLRRLPSRKVVQKRLTKKYNKIKYLRYFIQIRPQR